MTEYGINKIGKGAQIFEPVTFSDFPHGMSSQNPLRDNNREKAVISSGTITYCDVIIGDHFQSGHNVMIREKTRIRQPRCHWNRDRY